MPKIITTEDLIELAKQHGEDSEPDHEVGDLQELLRAAFSFMAADQLRAFIALPEVQDVLDGMGVDDPEEMHLILEELNMETIELGKAHMDKNGHELVPISKEGRL
jgi:hypothetical protein